MDVGLSVVKARLPAIEPWLDGEPVVLVEDGRLHRDRLARERIDLGDILTAARELHGLERLDQIKHAVLERSGGISIVPR